MTAYVVRVSGEHALHRVEDPDHPITVCSRPLGVRSVVTLVQLDHPMPVSWAALRLCLGCHLVDVGLYFREPLGRHEFKKNPEGELCERCGNPEAGKPHTNPRYVSYAIAHGREIEEMFAYDQQYWPGGKMTGFLLWHGEQIREWVRINGWLPDSIMGRGAASMKEYEPWLRERAHRLVDVECSAMCCVKPESVERRVRA